MKIDVKYPNDLQYEEIKQENVLIDMLAILFIFGIAYLILLV